VVESGPVGLVLPAGGAPLSAEQVEERTWTAPDGKPVSENLVSKVYRDHAGRMRIEWRVEISGEAIRTFYLLDPVAKCAYMALVENKTALRLGGPESGEFQVGFPAIGRRLPDGKWKTKTASLGTRVIQGIEVEGSRTIQTSEDEPPLRAFREAWSSQSLHLTLSEEASGPGWRHTANLQNIDRHEPDPKLFVMPSDYTIQE
jgi:hypothetical protein